MLVQVGFGKNFLKVLFRLNTFGFAWKGKINFDLMDTLEQIPWPFVIIVLILGVIVVTIGIWIMRRGGSSMRKYDIETISCLEAGKTCDEKHELRARKSVIVYARLIISVIVLVCVAGLFTSYWAIAIIEIIPSGIIAIYCWCSDWIEVYVSAEGVSDKSPFESLIYRNRCRKEYVSWQEITKCEIVTLHNTYGKFIRRYPVLKDTNGRFVFNGSSSKASQEDLDRLIYFIRGT